MLIKWFFQLFAPAPLVPDLDCTACRGTGKIRWCVLTEPSECESCRKSMKARLAAKKVA